MCKHGNLKTIIIKGKPVDVDSCIADMVKMFNDNGYDTIASCCGHGKIPGNIALSDGRFIDIHADRKSWTKQTEWIKEFKRILQIVQRYSQEGLQLDEQIDADINKALRD